MFRLTSSFWEFSEDQLGFRLYLKGGRAKIELGLCRGKKLYDKREAIAEREVKREIERVVRKG